MKQIRAALLRLAGILRLTRSDTDIDEELRSHLTMLADEYRRAGFGDAEAKKAAAAKFGSVTSAAEAYRDRRSVPALEQVVGDPQRLGQRCQRRVRCPQFQRANER